MGAVLAGGRGSRLGGAKATALLDGRPLISYALAAMAAAGLDAFVVAKPDTELPPLTGAAIGGNVGAIGDRGTAGAEVVLESAKPSHPLVGIIAALRHADRPVVVLAGDMPFASPSLLASLANSSHDAPLVVPAPGGRPEPLQARWSPALLPELEAALVREEPLRRTVAALAPRLLCDAELAHFGDPARMFLNVNDAADLERAERTLAS